MFQHGLIRHYDTIVDCNRLDAVIDSKSIETDSRGNRLDAVCDWLDGFVNWPMLNFNIGSRQSNLFDIIDDSIE